MTAETEATPQPWQKTYALFLNAGKRRFYFKNTDNGVTLTDWRLDWNAGGGTDGAKLQDIAQVRLQSGGDWKNPLNQCQITFADGEIFNGPHDPCRKPVPTFRDQAVLTVHDGTAYGVVDDAQTPLYRDFVHDLHARLALAPPGAIAFIRGLPQANFNIVLAAGILLGLMFVALPFVLLIWTGEIKVLLLLFAGIGMGWPLYRMLANNAPRPYDPKALPEELLE